MDDKLLEHRPTGLLYPLQLYRMVNNRERIFVPYHWHREIELIFVLQGTLLLKANDVNFCGKAGDTFWICQEVLHEMSTGDEATRYNAILFPMEFFSFEMFDYAQNHYLNPICRKEKRFPTLIPRQSAHYEKAWNELMEIDTLDRERQRGYQISTKACLLKFISLLIKDGLLYSVSNKEENSSDFKLKNLKAILTYIRQHYSEKLSLSDIAQAFNLSPKYFSRYFKKNLDRTFVEYLNDLRVERAADLLLNTDLPIGEISMTVGFDNFSYFIKQFKKIHSCTPSRFRRQDGPPAMYHNLTPLSNSNLNLR